jgi:spermidine/putrescine transport system permease protein
MAGVLAGDVAHQPPRGDGRIHPRVHPRLGAYVTPAILGGAKTTLLGDYIVSQFLAARNWPFGSALSFAIMAVMLGATLIYFRTGGRNL